MRTRDAAATWAPWRNYLLAVGGVAVTGCVRFLLDPFLRDRHSYALFLMPVFLVAWTGGWKPGLLALVLGGLVATVYFVEPRGRFSGLAFEDSVGLAMYLTIGAVSITQFELMRRGTRELLLANADLRQEVAARRQAEVSVRRLANIVGSSEDAIVGKDPDGVVTDWNAGAEKLYGYSAAETVGRNIDSLLPAEQRAFWDAVADKVRRRAHVEPFEAVRIRKDGTAVEVSVAVSPIIDRGELAGFSTISRDLTYQKRLEAELRQAVKMEAIGRLAGGVAHDFNNLLTVINGYCELLLTPPGPEGSVRRMLVEIQKAGKRAEKLTQQLLAYSRKQILQPKVLDINARIADIRKMLHRMLGEDMEIVTSLDPELGRVKADPTQIEQIVTNLAANARDAMPQGGTLTVTTRNVVLDAAFTAGRVGWRPGRYVLLQIADTGCGMDAAAKRHLFEPFYSTKEVGKGTGLGLAMVHGVVTQSDGHIDVESEPGRGTTFRIYLPRIDAAVESDGPQPVAAHVLRGAETVLLVEDDAMVLAYTRALLLLGGYRVLDANGSEQALAVSAGFDDDIHLLFSDVVMPGESGRQLAEILTRTRPHMKVLFMSGYTDDAVLRHGVSSESAAFLAKPFTPTDLARKVREVLESTKIHPVLVAV